MSHKMRPKWWPWHLTVPPMNEDPGGKTSGCPRKISGMLGHGNMRKIEMKDRWKRQIVPMKMMQNLKSIHLKFQGEEKFVFGSIFIKLAELFGTKPGFPTKKMYTNHARPGFRTPKTCLHYLDLDVLCVGGGVKICYLMSLSFGEYSTYKPAKNTSKKYRDIKLLSLHQKFHILHPRTSVVFPIFTPCEFSEGDELWVFEFFRLDFSSV